MEQRPAPSDADPQTAEPRASILIVDDHPANLVALEAILAPLGHELVMARLGRGGAARTSCSATSRSSCSTCRWPDMNGFETAGLIKQHPRSRHIPIIFITAVNRDAVHVFRGYSHGAVDYLVKPFDADILRSKAAVFIELYLQGREAQAAGAPAARARARGARAQEPGALPAPARRHAPVHLGGGRRTARSTTGTAPASRTAGSSRDDVARGIVLGVPAPGRSRRGPRALGGRAAQRRPVRTPGADQARRRRQLPLAPRARGPGARARRRPSSAGSRPRPTSTTRSAPRRRCARRSSCATTSCRSRRTSCARR